MTQQNAALVEQATASALTFKEESARLSGLVGQFRIDETARLPGTPARPAPAAPVIPAARPARTLGQKAGPKSDGHEEWEEF